jgi:predicted RNase H-like HicB family nuclease
MARLIYRVEVFEEDGAWAGVCPDLQVSSFGGAPAEAKDSLMEAVEAFLEGCVELRSLEDVLAESGYVRNGDVWQIRDRVTDDLVATLV